VLSACNTGSGQLREGEGVISLARGFFYAGCPSIVMTLWEVEDRSGAEIMGEFYRLLNAGKKKHEALRLAKLKHIENANPVTAHPHVWLCYVSIGNTDALNTSKDFYFFIAILLILIIILADQLNKNKKARKIRA
ncbi:MAG: CHAT domain-containing protein, partial [Mariniphaga sp.]|nr:CHAT domain-containing protein [Mariniphaga sp.]